MTFNSLQPVTAFNSPIPSGGRWTGVSQPLPPPPCHTPAQLHRSAPELPAFLGGFTAGGWWEAVEVRVLCHLVFLVAWEAAFARRKRRKAAGAESKSDSPRTPAPSLFVGRAAATRGGSGCRGSPEFPLKRKRPSANSPHCSFGVERQPLRGLLWRELCALLPRGVACGGGPLVFPFAFW